MLNKKGQGMPMNVIIIAIIVLVVLVILIAFFAGGFGSIVSRVRDTFSGQVTGQAKDTVLQTCQNMCDLAKGLPESAQRSSGYCTNSFTVDHDGDSSTKPQKMKCGSESLQAGQPTVSDDEKEKGIEVGGDLGISCNVKCSG